MAVTSLLCEVETGRVWRLAGCQLIRWGKTSFRERHCLKRIVAIIQKMGEKGRYLTPSSGFWAWTQACAPPYMCTRTFNTHVPHPHSYTTLTCMQAHTQKETKNYKAVSKTRIFWDLWSTKLINSKLHSLIPQHPRQLSSFLSFWFAEIHSWKSNLV